MLRDQRIFAAIYVTEGRISIRVICVKEWFLHALLIFSRLRFKKTLTLE